MKREIIFKMPYLNSQQRQWRRIKRKIRKHKLEIILIVITSIFVIIMTMYTDPVIDWGLRYLNEMQSKPTQD